MNWHIISLPLIVIGVVVYHLSQKAIPKDANPLITFAGVYLIAFSMCIIALVTNGDLRKWTELLRIQNWLPVLLLGLTALAIELGFLYAYRTGWRISTTGITTGAITASMLAIIGVLWFKEELTLLQLGGIVLCIVGVVCINTK
jgi:drug/metabolite transporter (DMT)-like permease